MRLQRLCGSARRQRVSALVRLRSFLIPPPRPQRISNQTPGRCLRLRITRRKRQRLVAHAIRLTVITRGVANPAQLDPQQRIIRLDAHCPLDGGCGQSEIAAAHLLVRLRDERR